MTPRLALLVVNSHSHRGAGAAQEVARASASYRTSFALSATKLQARSSAAATARNAAATGLPDTGRPLGIVPLGPANPAHFRARPGAVGMFAP
jgi:hypothetical protein